MSLFQRAFLYVTRKRAKTAILFLLLAVIATLILSGIAIKGAVQTAQLNVRQALGGIFTMRQNTSDSSKWKSQAVGNYGYQSFYTGEQLTVGLADTIVDKVGGIRGYNASATAYVVAANAQGKVLTLLESESDDGGLGGLLGSYGDFGSTVTTFADTDTEYDSYFTGGYLELVEGRHITYQDTDKVMLSKELAEQNGLKLGDKLILRMSEFKASMTGEDVEKTQVEVEIAGLFHATAKSSTMLSNWSMDNALYTTMDVLGRVRPNVLTEGYEKINFYVDDPAELPEIVKKVRSLPNIDPTDFVVDMDTGDVDAVMKPLTNMDRLVSTLILLVVVVGGAVLYLVLAGRVRERTNESGILLSLGLSRKNIVCQYLAEAVFIAVFAFAFSIVTSGLVARSAGTRLLDYTVAKEAQEGDGEGFGTSVDGSTIVNSSDFAPVFERNETLTEIQVDMPASGIWLLYGAGTGIIFLSVLAAALPVLRMKPREIFARMN
ncbi:MAG: ABC transporter permease [Lachnospiraceae bacterium]|nr:ABC transporter permease [Lachnospiraceae bacterium]